MIKIHKYTAVIAMAALLSSCAGMSDGNQTRAQGAGLGALLGAGLGAGVGAIAGGKKGIGTGAIVGAGIGAAAGFAYGDHVAKKKAAYASREAWLDQCIASARQRNRSAIAYNRTLKGQIAQLESRAATARASGNTAAYKQVQTEAIALQRQAQAQVQAVDKEIAAQKSVTSDSDARSASNYSSLRGEVDSLQGTRGELNGSVRRLASLSNQSSI